MSVTLLFLLLFAVLAYWLWTQILPERQKDSLLRPGLGDGLLEHLNERRHAQGMPMLEMEDDLMDVAERKAIHQVMTGIDHEGWEYPEEYVGLLGKSLFMEAVFMGSMPAMTARLLHQRDFVDGEWIRCGIGVAGGKSGQVAVALVLCREAWEPVPEVAQYRSFALGE